jgi:hypothetical protein
MMRAHQPGSQPIDVPETIPNPAVVPRTVPNREPQPSEPAKVPAPAGPSPADAAHLAGHHRDREYCCSN